MADPIETQNDPVVTKQCTKCREWKELKDFGNKTTRKDGLHWLCRPCESERAKAYRSKNTDKLRASNRARAKKNRAENLDAMRKYQREWLRANSERLKPRQAESRKKTKARRNKYSSAYHQKHRDVIRSRQQIYRSQNREIILAYGKAKRYEARSKFDIFYKIIAVGSRYTRGGYKKADVERLLKLQRGRCAHSWCRANIKEKRHVDHIIPIARGGSNYASNLQLLCVPCNLSKSSKHPITVAREHGLLL